MDHKSVDLDQFVQKVEEVYDQKSEHLGDLIMKIEREQKRYRELCEEYPIEVDRDKGLFLKGVYDGITHCVTMLKNYHEGKSSN
ncbi:hypothetical protein [Paenibacillus bouchesdurhonensis]|uniref:hypothetical protein n=1 Tax=Paenibacillus bouchesdurhonensis TaxID=1870990 RepID=UPI000DA62612|nr:hypothetical protein [Paenibacillus bouchesdurhonensis]